MKQPFLITLIAGTLTLFASAKEPVTLNFRNSDIRDVLALYERLTGCHLVIGNQIVGTLNVTSPAPVSSAKAIELIEAALFTNSFALIETKLDIIQIVGIGTNVRAEAIPTITKPKDLPTGERVIAYVYKLKFRDPKEIAQVLYQHIVPSLIVTPSITVDEPARAIIITERTSKIRSLIKLIGELDQDKPK